MERKIKNIIIALLTLHASSAFGLMKPPPRERPTGRLVEENRRLRRRVEQLERQIRELGADAERERSEEERKQRGLRRQREEAMRAQKEAGMGAMMAEMQLKRKLDGIEKEIRQEGINENLMSDLRRTILALKKINPRFKVKPFLRQYLMPPPRPAQMHPRMPRRGHVRQMSELFEKKAAGNHL